MSKILPPTTMVGFFIVCLVTNPQRYIQSVSSSLILFVHSVLPALFPFFFFSKLFTMLGGGYMLGKALSKPTRTLFHTPPICGYIFCMSIMCGYPVGSKLIKDMHENNLISSADAWRISAFCSTSGPIFVLGTIGALMFKDNMLGVYALVCHILGAMLNGIIFRQKTSKNTTFSPFVRADNILHTCMSDSIFSVLIVGGWIAIFGMICDVLIDIKVIDFLSLPLSKILDFLSLPTTLARPLLLGLIELTRGCKELSMLGLGTKIVLPCVVGLLSFGGVCISMQSMTYLHSLGISWRRFLLTKTSQTVVSVLLALLLCIWL